MDSGQAASTSSEVIQSGMDEKSRQRGFRFVLVVIFLDMLGVGLAVPVLPLLVGDFVSTADEQARWYGILAATFGLMQFLCMPLLGGLSDKIGRKPVLIISSVGMSLNFLVTAWAPSLLWLFLGRFIGGAFSASMSTASAYASDISTPEKRAKTFGLIGAAFGMGFICGPMLGGVLGSISYQLPFYVGAALCFGNAIFGYFFVTESLPKDKRSSFTFAKANPFSSVARLFARRDIGALIIVFALAAFAQILQQTTWVLYTNFKFGWGPKENGIALFLVGLTAAVVQAGLLTRLIKLMGEVRVSVIGLAVAAVIYFLNGLATAGWMIYALILFNFLSYASGPALQAIVSKASDPREQGALMGSLQSLSSLSIVIAPIVSTQLLAEVSHYPQGDWRMGVVFYLAAFLQMIGVILAWRFFSKNGVPVHPANKSTIATSNA